MVVWLRPRLGERDSLDVQRLGFVHALIEGLKLPRTQQLLAEVIDLLGITPGSRGKHIVLAARPSDVCWSVGTSKREVSAIPVGLGLLIGLALRLGLCLLGGLLLGRLLPQAFFGLLLEGEAGRLSSLALARLRRRSLFSILSVISVP